MSDPLRPVTASEAQAVSESVTGLAETVSELTRRLNVRTILLSLAVVLDIGLSLGFAYTAYRVSSVSHCAADQYATLSASLQARTANVDQQTDAQIASLQNQLDLFASLGGTTTTRDRIEAFLAYQRTVNDQVASLKAAKADREHNPLPTSVCR